jgi:quinone-modifying oxidoreductase, subunit QmoB
MDNKKISIYLCSGCEIGKSIDIDSLQDISEKEFQVNCFKQHPNLCSKNGIELIKKDIEETSPKAIVIGACSPRQNTKTLSFDKDIIVERLNFREQVIWPHVANNEDTQMLAEDILRMGIAKVNSILQPLPYLIQDFCSDILVVGGGITGITAAIEASKMGYNVFLLEKEKELGGYSAKLHKQMPFRYPYKNPEEPIVFEKIKEIENHPKIKALKSTEIIEISGQPGEFSVKVKTNGNENLLKTGAIVMATGWKPYDAMKLTEFGYGNFKNIITNLEMESLAAKGKILKPSDNKEVKSALFIQCAGSRDQEHLPYCSNYCCGTSLKQIKYLREANKDSNAFIVYKDIRTQGHYENFYKEIQNDNRVFFTKGDVKSISENGETLIITIDNTLLEEEIQLEVDLVILATGMTPADSDELNLNYRMGKGLPALKYDFPDSHFICFPYETRRTGIYAAGAIRSPMDITASIEDACGATMKAIQCIEATKRGESVHSRSGDRSFPELYLDRCTDCKRCTEECPFGAYDETEKGTPLPNPSRCRRCGICLGACPERIINFSDFSINSISSMIKAVNIPDEFEEKPRILVFVCENDAYPAFDMAGFKRLNYSSYVRIIPVRCIGSVNKVWISDALSQGFDGILMIGCKPGDDYQCHFIHGSELNETRGENISETLEKMMLEPERLKTEFLEINEYDRIPEIINDYVEIIEDIGPNPFKEM